jgi:hydroxymethylpyrimidine pyrophosphatase-like HAD family hydrolase
MQLCGYVATMQNGTDEIKKLMREKDFGRKYVSNKSVDENGILDIFDHFCLS